MADNTQLSVGSGGKIVATDEVTFSGDTAQVALQRIVHVTGSEGAKTVDAITDSTGLAVHQRPPTSTAGGDSNDHFLAAATTNPRSVKASAGFLTRLYVFNNRGTPIYVKFHNTAGTPTAGTGVVRTFGVQAGVSLNLEFPRGIPFTTGIGLTITTGITDADTGALSANDCVVDVGYL